jgi:hypothetical protein
VREHRAARERLPAQQRGVGQRQVLQHRARALEHDARLPARHGGQPDADVALVVAPQRHVVVHLAPRARLAAGADHHHVAQRRAGAVAVAVVALRLHGGGVRDGASSHNGCGFFLLAEAEYCLALGWVC